MILNELFDANKAVDRLLNQIDFTTAGTEANVISSAINPKRDQTDIDERQETFLESVVN